jgi:hypothetical protein
MTTLTIAQAEASSATSGLVVADTAANIAAGLIAYPNLATKVASFTLSAAGTLSASQAEQLGLLGSKMHLGGYALTVSDSLANLAASANTAGVALATSVAVVDAAYNLLAAPLSRFTHVASVTLVGAPTLSVAEINHLLLLPHFAIGSSATVTLSDTAGNINTAIATNPPWFHAVSTIDVQLDSTGVGAYAASLLQAAIAAGKHVSFVPSGGNTALVIDATVQNIAANAASLAALATHVTLAYTLAGAATPVTAAYGAALEGLAGFASHLSAVTVSDTAANVAAHASTLFGQGFAAIDVTSGTLATTAANLLASNLQLQGASATLSASATLTAAQAATLTSLHGFTLGHNVTLTVQDTMAHLLALSNATLAYVTTTELVAGSSITISVAQAASLAGLTGFTNSGASITVADTIANLQGSNAWVSVATATDVVDTAANILANASLALVTGAAAVSLSAGATVSAAGLTTLDSLPHFSRGTYTLIVADTAANLAANYAAVDAIASVAEVSGTSTVNASQAEALATLPTAPILLNGAQLIIGDTYANIIASGNTAGYALATGFSIADSGANLATAAGHNWGSITPYYQLNQASTVTAAQLTTLEDLGNNFTTNFYAITLADTIADVLALNSTIRNAAASIVITDIAADITTGDLNTLKNDELSVPLSIKITDSNRVSVSTATYSADTAIIDDIVYATAPTTGAVTVTGSANAVLGIASTLDADTHVGAVAINDTVADLTTAKFNSLEANLTVPLTITLSDPTDTLSFTAATYSADTADIDAVQNADVLLVTGTASAIAGIATTLAADTKVTGVSVTDTAAAINTNVAALTGLESKLSLTLTAGGAVSVATLSLMAGAETYTSGGFTLTLADSVANVTASTVTTALLNRVTSIAITDVSTNLTTVALNTLAADEAALTLLNTVPTPLTITLTDTGTVSVTAATYTADQAIIDDITNTGAVTVTGTAAAILAIATTLKNDAKVGSIVVSDASATIVTDLTPLLAIGSKLSVTLTDTQPITAALVPQLVQLDITNPSALTIADTGSNIAAVVESASTATQAFLTAANVRLSGNSVVTAADAAALESLSSFGLGGYTLSVWDTYTHLTSGIYQSALANQDVSAIYLQTNSTPITLTAANMLTLLALPNFHATNPGGTSSSITISDTAAHLSVAYATLLGDAAQLAGVGYVVNASATISDALLTELQTLGATAANAVSITVRDTAATIAANAPSQSEGGSITPAAWDLSASATITLSQAEILGAISSFSAGAYTLTVNQTGNTAISVTAANDLGNLGSALAITGGGHFDVQGTVAAVSALSNAALAIVTPQITDSFANIAALTSASALLGGTMTVNDSEAVSAATAEAFFGIIKVGNGAGIAAANVSFGTNVETVTDSIANLQTLTALPAYSGNSALAGAFTLGAADTVANLINASNTSFLEGLTSSTLAGSSTTTAANAEQLFIIANEIHFSKGSNALTVQDSAANLLNPTYSDGIGLANTLLLAGNDSTTAAGAETLLQNSKFDLTNVLTIADTPADLLDGTLGPLLSAGGYGSDVVVELSSSTTVDATTATELAALTGFADPSHYLTISDDPAYLLASSALTAETLAETVTIPTNETVTAATVLKLSEIPHFTPGAHELILGANDVADAATLAAIGTMGSGFEANGYNITMTADDIGLSAAQYNSLLSDNIITNGHLFGAIAATPVVTNDTEVQLTSVRTLTLSAPYPANGTFQLYDSSGNAVSSSDAIVNGSETVGYTDSAHNFSLTETIGAGTASAPVVLLDTATISSAMTAQGGSYSTVTLPNSVHVGVNEYLPVYTTATLPVSFSTSALVYDPSAHTLSLATQGEQSISLITLGGTSHPSALTASEIYLKTFS